MLHALRALQICALRSGSVYQFFQAFRIFQHRAWAQVIFVEGLALLVSLKQRLAQAFEQGLFVDICVGVVDEYAGFHVAVRVNMAVKPSSGDASSDIGSVILEINGEDRLAAFHGADLPDAVIHAFPLFRRQQQVGGR